MNFAQFIAPMPVDQFMAEHFGHRPAHIRGESPRGELLSFARLEELMAVLPHWTEENLKLIINSRPVFGQHFMEERPSNNAVRRADPAKVELFLRMGASLVGDHIEDIDPSVRRVASMLSDQFGGTAGANAYCSFKDVRAFNSHCDLHEVFAVQLEGEKVWQIYENRADAPVDPLEGENAQAIIDAAKGRVMMTVRMQPGDLLYIPRGYFHDALAHSNASLHLTFAVAPLNGRYIFRLLEELATRDPKFRAYLPDGRGDPAALREHLAGLAEEITRLMHAPIFETALVNRQRALVMRAHQPAFGEPQALDYYARTNQPFEVAWHLDGAILRHSGGEEELGALAEAIEWVMVQPAFSEQQLRARYQWLSAEEIARAIELVTRVGLFARYDPPL